MNDKMELLDINFIKNLIKDKALYFIFLTVLILTIPVLLYINDKPKFTVSMIVEAESSMKLSRLQRDWTNLHYIANLELPHVGEKDSKKNSLGDILLSDFLAVLTSPSKFYSVYEQYYNAGKITETFEDTYKKFNVVFDARTFSTRKNILLVSFTSDSEELSEDFLFSVLNKSLKEVNENLLFTITDLVEISQKYIFKGFTNDDFKKLNMDDISMENELMFNFLNLHQNETASIKLEGIKKNVEEIYSKNDFEIIVFSEETKQVRIDKINPLSQIIIYFAIVLILNYILFLFFVFKSRVNTK